MRRTRRIGSVSRFMAFVVLACVGCGGSTNPGGPLRIDLTALTNLPASARVKALFEGLITLPTSTTRAVLTADTTAGSSRIVTLATQPVSHPQPEPESAYRLYLWL